VHDDELKEALARYAELRDAVEDVLRQLAKLGRTDVPLDHPDHVDKKPPKVRARNYNLVADLQRVEDDAAAAFIAVRRCCKRTMSSPTNAPIEEEVPPDAEGSEEAWRFWL
jgi:hypothetical protein